MPCGAAPTLADAPLLCTPPAAPLPRRPKSIIFRILLTHAAASLNLTEVVHLDQRYADENSDTGALNPEPLETGVIICSCAVISERDIDRAVIEIMSAGTALIPTPGVVFRHLNKKMNCCTCAPVAVTAIYAAMDRLAADTRVCPFALADARAKLIRIEERRATRQRRIDTAVAALKSSRAQRRNVA